MPVQADGMTGDLGRLCPEGHVCYPARGLTCMVAAGFYWCGKCLSKPGYTAMSGGPAVGMYYGSARMREAAA